jgi:ANTAR domain
MTGKRRRTASGQAPGEDSVASFGAAEDGRARSGRSGRAGVVRRATRRSGDEVVPEGAAATAVAAAAAADQGGRPGGAAGDGASTVLAEDTAVVRRTKDGWRVGSDELPDLTCAMILADLLAAENGAPPPVPVKPTAESVANEAGRLRATVGQLEHALATRIRVEQAIGVLAERHRIKPRQAFEQLRDAARSRGRKVIDIAGDVVASATNPLLQLPDELSRPRSTPRRAARQQFGAQ